MTPRSLRGGFVAALIGVLGVSAACASSQDPGALQDLPGTSRQTLIQERVSPAIAYIFSEFEAAVSVPSLNTNHQAFVALSNKLVDDALAGRIGADDKSLNDAYVNAIALNPDQYFTAVAPSQQASAKTYRQCSGSIVTPDGYVVTAAHCIDPGQADLRPSFVETGLKPIIDDQVKILRSALSQTFDGDQLTKLGNAVAKFLENHATVTPTTSKTNVILFTDSSGHRSFTKSAAQLIDKGDGYPFRDIGIVKLDGYSNLPTLVVGDENDISSGQQVLIAGYPVTAETGSVDQGNLESLSTPTLSQGPVTAKKTTEQSVPILQTQAPAAPGNSGGPVLNDSGKLVGVLAAGSTPTTGQGQNYAISVSVLGQFLNKNNIHPRESATTQLYNRGLNDMHRHYFKRAVPEFQQAKALDPGLPNVDRNVQQSTEAIQQNRDQTPLLDDTALMWVVIGGAAAVLVATVVTGLLLVIRSRRRRTRVAAAQEPGWYRTEGGVISQDGAWRWDGRSWTPNIQMASPPAGAAAARDRADLPASEDRQGGTDSHRVEEHA